MTTHTWYECSNDCTGCEFCLGGLAWCTVCKAGEAELPRHCPGAAMEDWQLRQVADGELEFFEGKWEKVPECPDGRP